MAEQLQQIGSGEKADLAEVRGLWPSHWSEDDEDIEEFTQEEIDNEPRKRILWAAEHGKEEDVRKLLESDSSLVASCDGDLYTPLHRASYNNHTEVAKLLLDHGANVMARTEDGWTPLHSAARWNSVETAQVLMASGAHVNAASNGGLTPLHMAASDPDNARMIVFLLSCPFVDVGICSKAGELARTICERSSPHHSLFDMAEPAMNQLHPPS